MILSPADGALFEQRVPIAFDGLVADGEDAPDALSATWVSDRDGELSSEAPAVDGATAFTSVELSVGDHRIVLRVTNSAGLEGEDVVSIAVRAP